MLAVRKKLKRTRKGMLAVRKKIQRTRRGCR
jgi:hypothetical protein